MNAHQKVAKVVGMIGLFCLIFTILLPVYAQSGPDGGYGIYLPMVVNPGTQSLTQAMEDTLRRAYPTSEGFNPSIEQVIEDGDWALGVARLGVSMPDETGAGDYVYVLAFVQGGAWSAIINQDQNWSEWVTSAPESVMAPSLREMLLDEDANLLGEMQPAPLASLPELRLPWYPRDNPRSISGYLYNEQPTHTGVDAYAMDWGLSGNDLAATAGGTVVEQVCNLPNKTDVSKGYGNYILMDIGGGYYALYAHLESCAMENGKWYPQGALVGKSGTSGYSLGAHLHFRLRDADRRAVLAEPISGYSAISKGKSYYSNNTPPSSGPTCDPGDDQAAFYLDWNYSGQCVRLGINGYSNAGAIGLPNDSLTSIKVGGNVHVTLCRDDNFQGTCETFTSSDSNLSDNSIGNDTVSSLRVERKPGNLQVIEGLSLSTTTPATSETVRARFRIRNTGAQPITVDMLTAGGRKGSDWNGEWADFPTTGSFVLQPGQEYAYDAQRIFSSTGEYFAEPVVRIAGNWGGISGANRVNFTVADAGRLQVVEALSLSTTSPLAGEIVRARFRIRNVGNRAMLVEQLTAGGRQGSDWNGEWADFPSVLNITLQPGQEYQYEQSRSYDKTGGYFAEPVVKLAGRWGGIGGANRVTFSVLAAGRLQVIDPLSLTTQQAAVGELVTARFTVRNVGAAELSLDRLTAGGRRGRDWSGEWADFPVSEGIVLKPGQEYQYLQSRIFFAEGEYFSEPVVQIRGQWGGIGGANRVIFQVTPGIQVVEQASFDPVQPQRDLPVTARFSVRNAASKPISVLRILMAVRGPDCYDFECPRYADFAPAGSPFVLQPGEVYNYVQTGWFSTAGGGYFGQPVMEVAPGWWVDIPGGGRTTFQVIEAGRLSVTTPLALSLTSPASGEQVEAAFTVVNTGTQAIFIEQITAGGRRGTGWESEWADFPSEFNITIQPGQSHTYRQSRAFLLEGGYFAEPVVKLNGVWGGIGGANRVNFTVGAGIKVVQGITLSPINPQAGQPVTAQFRIRNNSSHSITIIRILAAARAPGCNDFDCPDNMDWPVSPSGIILAPGEEYQYSQTRIFTQPGNGYFTEPLMEVGNDWWMPIPGGSRVSFDVR